jgi:hypothetical protein
MDQIIDIWDQPPNSLPVLFLAGINAQKLEPSSNTQSPVSSSLGQNIVWPRLVGQDVPLVTAVLTIQYIAGLKSRMFILHHHADDGLVRYDIDRIVDQNGHRVQLTILAFKRSDGIDPFDVGLTTTADILSRDISIGDKRGLSDPAFTTIATGWPCRVASGKSAPKGKEDRAKMKLAIAYREVFMRPWFLDPSPDGSFVPYTALSGTTYNTQSLSHYHWLLIPSSTALNLNNEPVPGELYDISEIDNPGLAHHHLEVSCELVLA